MRFADTQVLLFLIVLFALGGVYLSSQDKNVEVTWESIVLRVSVLLLVLGAVLLFIPVATVGGILHIETKFLDGSFTHPGVLLVVLGAAGIYISKPKNK